MNTLATILLVVILFLRICNITLRSLKEGYPYQHKVTFLEDFLEIVFIAIFIATIF